MNNSHPKQYRQKSVMAVIGLAVRSDGSFLLTQRNQPKVPIWHHKWNIPGGGIEWGETPEEALKREFMEELGVVPIILYPHPIPVTALWYGKDTGYDTDAHILLLAYKVDIGEQVVDITQDLENETSDVRWFTVSELDALDTLPQTKETVRAILSLVDKSA